MCTRTIPNMDVISFISDQAIHQDHSFHLHLSQCRILHNLHPLKKSFTSVKQGDDWVTDSENIFIYVGKDMKDNKNASKPVARRLNLGLT